MKTLCASAVLSLSLIAVACDGGEPSMDRRPPLTPPVAAPDPEPGMGTGGDTNTFDHPAALGGSAISAREALERMQREGPPVYSARVHTCRKVRYRTIGRVLASRGVDLEAEADTSAGFMWRDADQALGAPNYGARVPETSELTVASASRLFDILVQAAPEIIAALPSRPECTIGGTGAALFDAADNCTDDGLTCLLGVPATTAHIELCNDIVDRAATPAEGRVIAVASMMAAAFTCE